MGASGKRRVLMVLDTLTGGGAERVVLDLLHAARLRDDLELVVAVSRNSGRLADHFASVARIHEYGSFRNLHDLWRFGRRLGAICRSEGIEAIFSHMTTVNKAVLRAKMVMPSLPPVYAVEHTEIGRQLRDVPSRWKRAMRPLEMRLLYPRAKRIVTVSQEIADDLAALCHIPPAVFATIHNPVDQTRKAGGARPAKRDQGRTVISVGRLEGVKNYKLLVTAFARAVGLRGHSEDRLVILGEGYQRGEIEGLAKTLGVAAQVSLPGFVDGVFDHLAQADLFVSTSRYEGLGNALLEAIGAGIPCIATTTAGAREVARHVGAIELVPQSDPDALAQAIAAQLDQGRLRVAPSDQDFIAGLAPDRVLERYLALLDPA